MPKIRFVNLTRPLWEHILERVAERAVTLAELQRLRSWVATGTSGTRWRLVQGFRVVHHLRHREYPKTVLKKGMKPFGTAL